MDLYLMRNELQNGKSIYDLKLKVTYYARVSTDKDEQLNSIKNQIDYYEEYIRANLNWAFVQGYIDEGISGTSVSKRESFLQMIEDAKASKFDFIITKEISRFSRNTI
ncbi:MAG: recombinase family protein, partial [Oscillospiraceae bacterium]